MPTTSLAIRGPIADSLDQLFEPVEFETLGTLFEGYAKDRAKMEQISSLLDGSNASLVEFFIKGNAEGSHVYRPERLFSLERGLKALDADYWSRALELTDVLESMPQKRRDEWHEQIQKLETPTFDSATVASTLQGLLVQRRKFFAERVDGIFRELSHEHVTNRPEGFAKRMIVGYVHCGITADWRKAGVINDLRCVIAKFMGRGEPRSRSTTRAINFAREHQCGEWVTLDGGALRIRLYKKGTAHLEVHPEMAWRLNSVLASIYPNAIPEKHRVRRKRTVPKDFKLHNRPISAAALELISDGRIGNLEFSFAYPASDSPAYGEAQGVLQALGGVPSEECAGDYRFDYRVREILTEVCISGAIPDQKAHQFYPTPRDLAEAVVAAAGIEDHHTVLEPSAGLGGLADLLPPERTTLVEVAPLHCEVLRTKGFKNVIQRDFLAWSTGHRFERVVMNPPFTKHQWRAHLEHAADLLATGGRIVAVLPAGARSKDVLPGFSCAWSEPQAFPGTSIEVVVLVADKP